MNTFDNGDRYKDGLFSAGSKNSDYMSYDQFVSILYEQELAKGVFIPAIAFGPSIGSADSKGDTKLGLGAVIHLSLKISLHRHYQGLIGTNVKYGASVTSLSEGAFAHGLSVGVRFLL